MLMMETAADPCPSRTGHYELSNSELLFASLALRPPRSAMITNTNTSLPGENFFLDGVNVTLALPSTWKSTHSRFLVSQQSTVHFD